MFLRKISQWSKIKDLIIFKNISKNNTATSVFVKSNYKWTYLVINYSVTGKLSSISQSPPPIYISEVNEHGTDVTDSLN